ncbi:isoprenylcysteine carboxylmethyltransferase family protein [Providencia stuartii]|uniref:methyltransferase family protein n=1 Tax=Providencia stuartii TaxID=588 RepID=UPI0028C10F5F|nr:isoprenylcysteine carboxylmethyltransferase family protein [Providencia stuartii]MDT7048627.1 isoprenylcysteine carboxylmethyltransferase family protein [Providencia stuartii]
MRIFRLPFLNWLIFNAIAFYYLDMKNSLSWNFSGWMGILAILVALESFGWIAASLYYFYRYKTSPNPIVQATALITEGPFKFSRNPLYLAFTSLCVSLALFTQSPYFLVSGLVFWLVTDLYTIPQEEKFLSARFQEEWQRYSQQTRRWL